jgi:hypothetical protein
MPTYLFQRSANKDTIMMAATAEEISIARILMSRALGYIMKRFIVVRTTVILAKNTVINRFVVSLPIPSIADRCLYTSSLISLQKSLSLWHSLLNI